jgi:hypothetical protein
MVEVERSVSKDFNSFAWDAFTHAGLFDILLVCGKVEKYE